MMKTKTAKIMAICSALIGCSGVALAIFYSKSLAGPVLIAISTVLAILVVRLSGKEELARAVGLYPAGRQRLSSLGDGLMVVGVLLGVAALQFLNLPTKEDREFALAIPALIFLTGAGVKGYGLVVGLHKSDGNKK